MKKKTKTGAELVEEELRPWGRGDRSPVDWGINRCGGCGKRFNYDLTVYREKELCDGCLVPDYAPRLEMYTESNLSAGEGIGGLGYVETETTARPTKQRHNWKHKS